MRAKIKKVHFLALGTGYAEDASWAHLLLAHHIGFTCVQDALINVNSALIALISGEIQAGIEHRGLMRKWALEEGRRPDPIYIPPSPESLVEDTLTEIIHGNYQDHGDFWEVMSQGDWLVGGAWVNASVAKHGICFIDRAPQLVNSAPLWSRPGTPEEVWERSVVKSYMNLPKGVKVYKHELKGRK